MSAFESHGVADVVDARRIRARRAARRSCGWATTPTRCRCATRSCAAPGATCRADRSTSRSTGSRPKGYLRSRLADPTPERGGRAKRYYALRPRAVDALKESRRALVALWRGLEAALGWHEPSACRASSRLFARLVPADLREPIAGDLHEEYLRDARARRPAARGRLALVAVAAAGGRRSGGSAPHTADRCRQSRDELRGIGMMWDGASTGRRRSACGCCDVSRASPLVAVFALALGIGANTAIFSIVDAVLWRPLPYPHADRVMSLAEQRPRESRWFGPIAPADYFDWRRDSRSFSAMAAYTTQSPSGAYNLTGDGEPERVRPLEVTPPFLGVHRRHAGARTRFPRRGRNRRPPSRRPAQRRAVAPPLRRRSVGRRPHDRLRRQAVRDRRRAAGRSSGGRSRPDVVVPLALDDHDRTLRGGTFPRRDRPAARRRVAARAREELRIIGARLGAGLSRREREPRAEPPAAARRARRRRPDRCCWCCSAPSASCC